MAKLPTRLYFVQPIDGGAIKIGIATDVHKRLGSMQTGSPVRLTILAHRPGTRADEFALHKKHAAHRIFGEWFNPHDEVLAEVRHAAQFDQTQTRPPREPKTDRQKFLDEASEDFLVTTFRFSLQQTFSHRPDWKREVARLANVTERAVSNWMTQKRPPRMTGIINLMRNSDQMKSWFAMITVCGFIAWRCKITEFDAMKVLIDFPELQGMIWTRKTNDEVFPHVDRAFREFAARNSSPPAPRAVRDLFGGEP